MKSVLALALASGLLVSSQASAQKIDLSTIKCGDFIKEGPELHGQLLMWLSGNATDEDAGFVIDFDAIVDSGKKLGRYCAENPAIGLITAYKAVTK